MYRAVPKPLKYRILLECWAYDSVTCGDCFDAEYIVARFGEPVEDCRKALDELAREGALEVC